MVVNKNNWKVVTQMGIGAGAVLCTLALTGEIPAWIGWLGGVAYMAGLWFN